MEPFWGEHLLAVLDLVGIFVFATSGALMAIRKDFDIVGIVLLAAITALGGGIMRDLLIGATPPVAFTNVGYLLVALFAALVTFFAHPVVERLNVFVQIFDAVGLGLFAVAGTIKALEFGLGPLQAAILGVVTGVGGGVLRDVIAMEVPTLVRRGSELYSVPAGVGTAIVVVSFHFIDSAHGLIAVLAAVVIIVFRLLAMRFHWTLPSAKRRLADI